MIDVLWVKGCKRRSGSEAWFRKVAKADLDKIKSDPLCPTESSHPRSHHYRFLDARPSNIALELVHSSVSFPLLVLAVGSKGGTGTRASPYAD